MSQKTRNHFSYSRQKKHLMKLIKRFHLFHHSQMQVHVAKLERASFANRFRFVDRYRVNLVLLRTCRLDSIMKDHLTPKLSLAACRNRDRMNVDTKREICSEHVCTVVSAAKSLTQTLIPEVYRLYDGNKPGTLGAPVSICSGTWGMLLIADKGKVKSSLHDYIIQLMLGYVYQGLTFQLV